MTLLVCWMLSTCLLTSQSVSAGLKQRLKCCMLPADGPQSAVSANSFVPGNVRRDAHFHSFHSPLDQNLENRIGFILVTLVVQPCPLMSDECFLSNEFAGTAEYHFALPLAPQEWVCKYMENWKIECIHRLRADWLFRIIWKNDSTCS